MQLKVIYAVQAIPDDEDPELHEFGLRYFRFIEAEPDVNCPDGGKPAVWIRFSDVSQIETLQFHCPEAKLGPSHAFTEALVTIASIEEAEKLSKKIGQIFTDAEMKEVFDEDTMEDY